MENRFKLADSYLENLTPDVDLYNNIWFANTTSLLHAPREVDKSSLAIDIALGLTKRDMTVFYLTTGRLSQSIYGKIKGNNLLYVHQPEFAAPDDPKDYADIVIKDIEDAITATGASVFIIDSITRIAALSFGRNSSPAYLMKRLVALQVRHKISILVISHDTSKAATRSLVNLSDSEINISLPSDVPEKEQKKASKKPVITDSKDNVNDSQPKYNKFTIPVRDSLERYWNTL